MTALHGESTTRTPLITTSGGPTMHLLVEAEACARSAGRILELSPDPGVRREAKGLVPGCLPHP